MSLEHFQSLQHALNTPLRGMQRGHVPGSTQIIDAVTADILAKEKGRKFTIPSHTRSAMYRSQEELVGNHTTTHKRLEEETVGGNQTDIEAASDDVKRTNNALLPSLQEVHE